MGENNSKLKPPDPRLQGIFEELRNPDWQIRELGVFKLAEYEEEAVLDALVAALDDPMSEVRETAAGIIGERCIAGAVDALRENYLKHNMSDPNFPWALGRIKNPKVVPDLIDALDKASDLPNKERIIWALGEMEDFRSTEHLIPLLDNPELAESTLRALAKIQDPRAVEPIKERLEFLPKTVSIIALGQLGEESITDILRHQLEHKFFLYRREAALALVKLKDPGAIPALQERLEVEDNEWVAEAIEDSISKLRKLSGEKVEN